MKIIIYGTQYGAAKKYAEELSRRTEIPYVSYEEIDDINTYLERLQNYLKLEESTLLIGLIYIDRFCSNTGISITPFNVYKLIFTSLFEAAKYNEDKNSAAKFYSLVGGISAKEIPTLEWNFLYYLGFELYISEETYNLYKNRISLIKVKKMF